MYNSLETGNTVLHRVRQDYEVLLTASYFTVVQPWNFYESTSKTKEDHKLDNLGAMGSKLQSLSKVIMLLSSKHSSTPFLFKVFLLFSLFFANTSFAFCKKQYVLLGDLKEEKMSDLRIESPGILILAARRGSQMKTVYPKAMRKILKKPLLFHMLTAIHSAQPLAPIAIVVGYKKDLIMQYVKNNPTLKKMNITFISQNEQLGTAHAVLGALKTSWAKKLRKTRTPVLVLPGDLPLIPADLISAVTAPLSERFALRILSTQLLKPDRYAKVIREKGEIREVTGKHDLRFQEEEEEGLSIEVAVSTYFFDIEFLYTSFQAFSSNPDNPDSYSLRNTIRIAQENSREIESIFWDESDDLRRIHTESELRLVRKMAQDRLN